MLLSKAARRARPPSCPISLFLRSRDIRVELLRMALAIICTPYAVMQLNRRSKCVIFLLLYKS